jgi:hypothetical protein
VRRAIDPGGGGGGGGGGGAVTATAAAVSRRARLVSRRGCSVPANASGFAPHRAPISSRFGFGQVSPTAIWAQLTAGFGSALPAAHGAFSLLAASLSRETLADGHVPYQLCVPPFPPARAQPGRASSWL